MFAEPLELALDLGARLLVLGGLESGLELLEPLVHIGLALGQLAQAAQDLARLALFLFLAGELLLRTGRPLFLVAVLIVGELELLELALARTAAATAALAVAADDLKFAGPQLEQRLIRSLLGGQGRVQGLDCRLAPRPP